MKKFSMLIACCVVIPNALFIGWLTGALLGSLAGVAGLIAILLMAQYSRRISAAKKLEN